MRKVLVLGLLTLVAGVAGCQTVTMTGAENRAQMKRVCEMEMRQIGDDWNLIWLSERPSRLTRWHSR